jgi:uncharacterized DUF497 family protein
MEIELIFTRHARQRMRERGISVNEIKEALAAPDILKDAFLDRRIAVKYLKDRALEVVFFKKGRAFIIITAYYAD